MARKRVLTPLLDEEEERTTLERTIAELSVLARLEEDEVPELARLLPPAIRAQKYVVQARVLPPVKGIPLEKQRRVIAVPRGALSEAKEPLMQSVLAHEIGHVKHTDDDSVRRYNQFYRVQNQAVIVAFVALVAEVVTVAKGAPDAVPLLISLFTVAALVWCGFRFVKAVKRYREMECDADIFAVHLLGDRFDAKHYFDNQPAPGVIRSHPKHSERQATFAQHRPCKERGKCKDGRELLEKNY